MWSRRNAFPLNGIQDSPCAPLTSTPSRHHCGGGGGPLSVGSETAADDEVADPGVNFITSLAYTLIPEVTREEAESILSWVFDNNNNEDDDDAAAAVAAGLCGDSVAALKQVEYFFTGTDNGHLLMFPLLPPSMHSYATKRTTATAARRKETGVRPSAPWNAGPKRLLHRHKRNESVMSVGTLGTLVASGATDAHVHLSIFHPVPQHIVTIPHPSPLRALLLWEGSLFVARETDPQRRCTLSETECSIAYIITGDESGTIRLWRVDVEYNAYFLVTVFAVSVPSGCVGFASPLQYLACEDGGGRARASTKQSKVIRCLAIDDEERLLAGVDGGIVAWSLSALPWKQGEEDHILCWDEEERQMVLDVVPKLCFRVERLVNMSVWVKGAGLLQETLSAPDGDWKKGCSANGDSDASAPQQKSKWKPKYGTHIAGGFEVGVVSNVVAVSSQRSGTGDSAVSLLQHTCASLVFPSLKNTVFFPLWAVEPVFTPLQIMSTRGSTCFAILVLQHGKRIATSGSDGAVTVWLWEAADAIYIRALVSGEGQGHRGMGRHICLLRSPDIFISCGYNDGMLKEWHIYDEPELLMRCERHFTLLPSNSYDNALSPLSAGEQTVLGVSCAVSFPAFYALFLVGVFENVIHAFSVSEVHGCAPPADYIYNGCKTVRVELPVTDTATAADGTFCGGGR